MLKRDFPDYILASKGIKFPGTGNNNPKNLYFFFQTYGKRLKYDLTYEGLQFLNKVKDMTEKNMVKEDLPLFLSLYFINKNNISQAQNNMALSNVKQVSIEKYLHEMIQKKYIQITPITNLTKFLNYTGY